MALDIVLLYGPRRGLFLMRVDTWRKKCRAEYPGWDYQLWTDKEVL